MLFYYLTEEMSYFSECENRKRKDYVLKGLSSIKLTATEVV